MAADCIPIVGAVKPLVPKDKRFNHSKVWCTFIFIDLQATVDCSVYDEPSFKYIELSSTNWRIFPTYTGVLMYIWHALYDYITITICPPHSLNMYLVNFSHLICIQIIKKILIVNVCCVPQKLNVVNIWSCICYCNCLFVGTILFFPAYLSSIKIFLLLCQK